MASSVLDVLSSPTARQAIESLKGRKYSHDTDAHCTRAVARECVEYLADRQQRRIAWIHAEQARKGDPDRLRLLVTRAKAARIAQRDKRWRKRVLAGSLGVSTVRSDHSKLITEARNTVSTFADCAIRCLVRAVGTIGEQCERDLRELRTSEGFEGKKSRHHKLERTTLDRVQVMTRAVGYEPWSAILITVRDYKSFGSSNWGENGEGYGSRGGSSFRCYLVVRDTTTGEAHILRVPPKYGNDETQFYGRFYEQSTWAKRLRLKSSEQRRIHAAVAYTFGLRPEKYAPQIQA